MISRHNRKFRIPSLKKSDVSIMILDAYGNSLGSDPDVPLSLQNASGVKRASVCPGEIDEGFTPVNWKRVYGAGKAGWAGPKGAKSRIYCTNCV